jgi:hypothetical protein
MVLLILVKTKNKINPARHETICFLWLHAVLKNTMTLTPLTPAEHSQSNIQDLKTEFSSTE